jgi:deoxyuridine 5'-triphosphate nucleotidohydrolase
MLSIKVKWVGPGDRPDRPPLTRGYHDDAGLDLYCSRPTIIPSMQFRDVPAGVAVELPDHCWAEIASRSSAIRKLSLFVIPGTIDTGFRGELFAACFNFGPSAVQVAAGDRVAQLILHVNETQWHDVEWADELAASERGLAGFGSTGR